MALDPVPWFVGKGAKHSAAAARNLAWNATGGKTGIATPTSLQIRPLNTPGGAVQIMPGGGVIESTYGGALQQSYTARNASATTVNIPPNNTNSTVTRHITLEINDPTYAGPEAADKETGPYNFFRVSTSRQNIHPELYLGSVVQPPQTSVIQGSMIRDGRQLANPRRETYVLARPRVVADKGPQSWLNAKLSSGGEYFPGGGGFANTADVVFPEWANSMILEADWMSVRYSAGQNVNGRYWVEWGTQYKDHTWPNKQQWEYGSQQFQFDSISQGGHSRTNWRLMDTKPVPAKFRGRNVTFAFKAAYNNTGSDTDGVMIDEFGGLGLKVTFLEQVADWEDFN